MTVPGNMYRPRHILLDMDGVLADFVSAAARVHGREDALPGWPLGTWEMHDVFGITQGAFWRAIDACGAEFWAQLEPLPWADELVRGLREIAPMTILSSPSRDPGCLEGKVRWLQRQFGRSFRDFLIGPPKHLLAQSGAVLVDDSPRNIREFRRAGGHGVLFPQPWNDNHGRIAERLQFVLAAVASGPEASVPESGAAVDGTAGGATS